jgi:DNA uptake protein ComE-like DNA-binding protein
MAYHSQRISFFRKPAFIGTSLFGSFVFLILQINYWQTVYAKNVVIDVKQDSLLFVTSKNHNYSNFRKQNFGIYPSVAIKILNAIHHSPNIRSLSELCAKTSLDSAILLHTLNDAAKQAKVKKYKIDLNQADSAEFESLPGIGNKTARRIIKYRDRLGGFINKFQLLEIKYFDSSLLLSNNIAFDVDPTMINKIDINHCEIAILYRHPYIGKDLAKIIWAYKNAHFPLTVNKFNEILGIPRETSIRLTPYLLFR